MEAAPICPIASDFLRLPPEPREPQAYRYGF